MAEIGLIASVVGVAGAGIKLSTTLYTFAETVATAADSIKAIAKDVSLTSAVLDELSSNLKHDEQTRLYSGNALKTAQTVVRDCEAVFKQIDAVLSKSVERIGALARSGHRNGKGGKVVLSAVERLKWPFLQPKMQELRANLERLKSTLVLMLNVLTYAGKVHAQKERQALHDDYQRLLIENLVAANQEATRNFQTLMRTIGPGDDAVSAPATPAREPYISELTLAKQRDAPGLVQPMSTSNREANLKQPNAPDPSVTELPRSIIATEDNGSMTQFAVPGTASATEKTVACLKRIQQALDQFEASEENVKSAGHIAVSIEVYKRMLHGDGEARKRKPWEIAYIKRREDGGLKNKPDGLIILSSGSLDPGSGQASGSQRTAALQAQIDNTVGVMRESINRVSLRGARLSSLGGEGDSKGEVDRLIAQRANEVALLDGQPRVDNGFNPSATHKPAVQDQINDTVRLMRENIDNISQRGERLDELQDKSRDLVCSAQGFRRGAARARKNQGLLSTLATAWNNLPSPRAALSSADEFLQEKFTAAFYQEAPEVDNCNRARRTKRGGVKDHKRGPIITPTHANTFRSSPDAIHSKALPVTVPSNEPAYQPPDSRISVSPATSPDISEHPSSSLLPPEYNLIDVAPPANDIEVWNVETRIQRRKENTRMNSRCSLHDDEVLVSSTDQERPGVVVRTPGTTLNEASGSKLKGDDDKSNNDSASSLDLRQEVEADGVPSLESLLREWTTLYD